MSKDQKIQALRDELAAAQRRAAELQAQLACTLGAAFESLPKAGDLHGSGVILSLVALGGRELIRPVMIRDGLSPDSISALRADVCRSFEQATMVNPAMADFHAKRGSRA